MADDLGVAGTRGTHSWFWSMLQHHLGRAYARSWADNHVMSSLDGRTASEALDGGVPPKAVWEAVHRELGLPDSER